MDAVENLKVHLEKLAPTLGAVAAADQPLITGLRRLSGGASQETWAFDVRSSTSNPALVMRRATPGGEQRHLSGAGAGLATEAELIRLAAAAGVPVPVVRHVLRADDQLGDGFIMDRLQGETLGRKVATDARFATARLTLAEQCGAALARIHSLPVDQLPRLRLAPPAAELEHYVQTHRRHQSIKPVFELAFRWLHDHLPQVDTPVALVHGDFRNGNLMIGEDGLRAVLDWELAHIGDPMEDLGWICVNSWRFGVNDQPVGGFGQREQLFSGYEAAGGKVDPERVFFWEVLGTLKWGIMCQRMAQAFLSGAELNVERAAIGRRSSETEIDLLTLLSPRSA